MASQSVKDALLNVRGQIDDLLALFEARAQGQREEYRTRLESLFRKVVEMKNSFAQTDLNVLENETENAFGPWPLPGGEGIETGVNWRIQWNWAIEVRPTTTEEDEDANRKRQLENGNPNGGSDNSNTKSDNKRGGTEVTPEAGLGLGGLRPGKRIRQLRDDEYKM